MPIVQDWKILNYNWKVFRQNLRSWFTYDFTLTWLYFSLFWQSKIYPRVLNGLKSENVSEFSWSIQLAQEIWSCHQNLDHFFGNPNILELALTRALHFESCPSEVESRLRCLISEISSHLKESHISWIEKTSYSLLDKNRQICFSFLQTFLCSLQSQVLARLNPELFSTLFAVSSHNSDEQLVLPVSKIR